MVKTGEYNAIKLWPPRGLIHQVKSILNENGKILILHLVKTEKLKESFFF